MLPPLSRDTVRAIDRQAIEEYGLPGVVLMENAGRGATEVLLSLGTRGPVLICAGKGNNGGDGFVMARHLDLAGVDVRILLFANPEDLRGDAATNFQVVSSSRLPIVTNCGPDNASTWLPMLGHVRWIVDALLGTGTVGEIREPYRTAILAMNQSGRKILAVDLPSGLDCDTGLPLGPCVQARRTVTFVAPKRGFTNPEAARYTGVVHVEGIGAPRQLLKQLSGRGGS